MANAFTEQLVGAKACSHIRKVKYHDGDQMLFSGQVVNSWCYLWKEQLCVTKMRDALGLLDM